ncbi:MAG TPA: hypothetical protein VGM27_12235, partial [Acidobacteriaceae bacterium]
MERQVNWLRDGQSWSPALGANCRAKNGAPIDGCRASLAEAFWWARYYDFNVFTEEKRVEKLRYMHRNLVQRGLVQKPDDWPWLPSLCNGSR